jgi:hypothetical protein
MSDDKNQASPKGTAELPKTAADLFGGRIGQIQSDGRESAKDTGKAFTEYVLKKKREGTL